MSPPLALGTLFAGLCLFFGFFAHGYLENTDTDGTMHAARALYLRGDAGLQAEGENTWAGERYIAQNELFCTRGANGKIYVWFPIGHQLLMLPCIALGELFAGWFPQAEADYLARKAPHLGEFYWTRFFISFLPAIFAAGSAVMLLLICLSLGSSTREAMGITAVATLCTQFWPGASETMSDGPGMFFLFAMAALVFRSRAGKRCVWGAFLAGVCGGWAVLMRYPHVVPVLVLVAVAVHTAWTRRAWGELAAVALGAMPEVAILLVANLLRYDSLTETGYSPSANPDFWRFPVHLGVLILLVAPGKGALWFSLPLLFVLPAFFRRKILSFPWLPVLLIFVLPVAILGHFAGLAGGQCWGVRYLTPAVALMVTVALAMTRPWQRRPVLFAVVCVLGFLISVGGVITPYRGQQNLAYKAGAVVYPGVDEVANNVNFDPRFSPLHTHWIYAWLSATGRLERGGAENTTVPLFGVAVEGAALPPEIRAEDAGFRHWWMVGLAHNRGVPFWPLFAAWLFATIALLRWGARGLLSARTRDP